MNDPTIHASTLEVFGRDAGGDVAYLIEWKAANDSVLDFSVGMIGVTHPIPGIWDNPDMLFTGRIKWDGCTEIRFRDSLHLCGYHNAIVFKKLIDRLFEIAAAYFTTTLPDWDCKRFQQAFP